MTVHLSHPHGLLQQTGYAPGAGSAVRSRSRSVEAGG